MKMNWMHSIENNSKLMDQIDGPVCLWHEAPVFAALQDKLSGQ